MPPKVDRVTAQHPARFFARNEPIAARRPTVAKVGTNPRLDRIVNPRVTENRAAEYLVDSKGRVSDMLRRFEMHRPSARF